MGLARSYGRPAPLCDGCRRGRFARTPCRCCSEPCWRLDFIYGDSVPLLTLIVLLPVVGLLAIGMVSSRRESLIRVMAVAVSLIVFGLTLVLWRGFDGTSANF